MITNIIVPGPPPPPITVSMPPPSTKGRTNLLKDIEKGKKLRKVKDSEKNDRSAAFIDSKGKKKKKKKKKKGIEKNFYTFYIYKDSNLVKNIL